jgi:hypothetical protein
VAGKAHFGGECIDAGCVDGLRIPVKMVVIFHRNLNARPTHLGPVTPHN